MRGRRRGGARLPFMRLRTFALDEWLDRFAGSIRYDLAASTGPSWTLSELRSFMSTEDAGRLFGTPLVYRPGHGGDSLRREVASLYRASPEDILIVNGASEALLAMFFLVGEPGGPGNVIVPHPAFPPVLSLPESLGLEVRRYPLDRKRDFALDPERIEDLLDERTALVFVNSPHNPTGAVASEESLRYLDERTSKRGIQLVVDEVYHPIYHYRHPRHQSLPSPSPSPRPRSAGEYTAATVVGDFSKAFSLSGIRVGWILERDPRRRERYWNARAHFSISSNFPGELLAEVAVRNRERIFARTTEVAASNLALLDRFFRDRADIVDWVRPAGGMTAFPWLRSSASARGFAEAAAARGVLIAPGDTFDCPSHFRLGFGACAEGFAEALDVLSRAIATS
jgi:aspartate/methionine/tyrosine aminotransferase